MVSLIDDEKIKRLLADLVNKIDTEADPELLIAYRSRIRKEVSLFKRSYLAAYLLMQLDQGKSRLRSGRYKRGGSRDEAAGDTPYTLTEKESVRLFVNIGRNRKVFPREFLGFITAEAEVSREDIGAIRILENYSFIQVRIEAADAIIEALNGKSFRGKTLAVSYARSSRKEEAGETPETGSFPEDDEPSGETP
jgi:hypothetical protein